MQTVLSKVIYKSGGLGEWDRLLIEECKRVAESGGTFSIEHRHSDNWYTFYTIVYPDNIQVSADLASKKLS